MITVVSRWNITLDQARTTAQEVASIIRDTGAQEIRIGSIQIGQNAGKVVTTVTYENYEAFGRSAQQLGQNTTYQQALSKIHDKLIDRQIVQTEDVR